MSSRSDGIPIYGVLDRFIVFILENRVLEKLGSCIEYGILVVLFAGFVYAGLRPIWQVRFDTGDLLRSRVALALAPLPLGILLFNLGFSRPYLRLLKLNSRVPRLFMFAIDWVFIGTLFVCLLVYLINPFTVIASRQSKAIVTVYYATDRQPATSQTNLEFSGAPSRPELISYGVATVPIIWQSTKPNSSSLFEWDKYAPRSEVRHFTDADQFVTEISTVVRKLPRHEALIFIHGFNNGFEGALGTAAKLAYDLKFDSDRSVGGVTVLYSWPSDGDATSYDSDYEHASWSVDHLADFLLMLKSRCAPLKGLQLIAHSMGTRVLGEAVKVAEKGKARRLFDNVALAAADVDEDTFAQFSPALREAAGRITLYVSPWDWALFLSSGLHKGYRVGLMTVGRDGMDVIDTLGLEASPTHLKHSYVFESQFVLNDLFELIRHDEPPPRISLVKTRDKCCWQFEKR